MISPDQIKGTPAEQFLPGFCEDRPKEVEPKGKQKKLKEKEYIDPVFLPHGVWAIPLQVQNSENGAIFKKSRIAKGGHERRKVASYLGQAKSLRLLSEFRAHVDSGRMLRVKMVKLGPAEMDDDGLGTAFKYVRDTVALFLGLDDGPKNRHIWQWVYDQERLNRTGIRIEISKIDAEGV